MREEHEVTLPKNVSPLEYAVMKEYDQLSPKQIEKGKYRVKIKGTKDPMPWDKVYSQIRNGFPYEDIEAEFGNIKKIILFAIQDDITYFPYAGQLMDETADLARKKSELAKTDLQLVKTIEEGVARYAPDLIKDTSLLASAIMSKGIKIVNEKYATSSDLMNVAKAAQTMTDVAGVTQRHASSVQVGNAQIQVSGFDFVLDEPPAPVETEVIEVKEDDNE